MKRCTGECARLLPRDAFGPGKGGRPGPRCRDCVAAAARRRRAADPEFQKRAAERQARADLAARGLKPCPKCNQTLPVDAFFTSSDRAGGRYPYCRECCKDIDAARRPKMPWRPLTYAGVHGRLPSIEARTCWRCGGQAEEWAYDHSDPDELVSDDRGLPYSQDLSRYAPMCRSCHRKYDMTYRTETGTARPRGFPRRLKPCSVCRDEFWSPNHRRKTCSAVCETELRRRSKIAYEERVLTVTGLLSNEVRNQAKLNAEAVRDIRGRHADKSATAKELAAIYGIALSTVYGVINREAWRHVA